MDEIHDLEGFSTDEVEIPVISAIWSKVFLEIPF